MNPLIVLKTTTYSSLKKVHLSLSSNQDKEKAIRFKIEDSRSKATKIINRVLPTGSKINVSR